MENALKNNNCGEIGEMICELEPETGGNNMDSHNEWSENHKIYGKLVYPENNWLNHESIKKPECNVCYAFNACLPPNKKHYCAYFDEVRDCSDYDCIDIFDKKIIFYFLQGEKRDYDGQNKSYELDNCGICGHPIKMNEISASVRYHSQYFGICQDCYIIREIDEIRNNIKKNFRYHPWCEMTKFAEIILTKPFTIEQYDDEKDIITLHYDFEYRDVKDIVDKFFEEHDQFDQKCKMIDH